MLRIMRPTISPPSFPSSPRFLFTSTTSVSGPPSNWCPAMPFPPIPLELVDHAIDYLHDDIHALAACALASRILLPRARFHIWREIVVPVQTYPTHPRMERFMEILDANADIAPLVLSLTLKGVLSPQPRNRIRERWDDPAGTMCLWEKLPNLRVLRLVNLRFNTGLHQLLSVAYSLPHLDELAVVGSIAMLPRECGRDRPSYRESVVALDSDAPPSLKRLRVTEGSISWSFLEGLAMLLREPAMHAPLEALDLSCIARSSNFKYASLDRTDTLPSQAWAPVIASLAPTLRQCTLGLLAEECWPKNLEDLYGSLARCTRLQSLGIRCSVLVHPLEDSSHCPFIFLDMLADVLTPSSSLSEGVLPRFPDLETLSIEWVCASEPIPPGCADACEKLARAIEEGRSRLPRLAHLNVAVSTSRRTTEISASQWREVEAQEPILRSCFERVALVGVQLRLDVSVD